ncbi:MAG: hypothetical protein OHK0046_37370 [Anaerolineae bacterium]
MVRSFTDRVLGGVCGGLAAGWRISPWLLRGVFVLLAILTLGTGALLYVALWWALPQESLLETQGGSAARFIFVLVIVVTMLGAWVGHVMGWLRGADGSVILLPVLLLVLGIVFSLRQLRGS